MESCKTLVVGGAGYLGGLTVDLLRQKYYSTSVCDTLMYEDRYLKDVMFYNTDVRNTDEIVEITKRLNCNNIVIMAAIVGDAACNVNQKLTEEVNYQAVKNLCEKLPEDVHVIFMSTCSVYGANKNIVDETSKTNPLSAYASTKLRAEKHVLDRNGTIFRLGTVYGLGDQFSRIRADLVVNTLTIKAFSEGEVTVFGGNQWRPVISAKDVAGYVVEACERREEVAGLYNISYKNVTISDIANTVKSVFPDIKINKTGHLFEDERNYKVSNKKSKKVFKYEPLYRIIEEVQDLKSLLAEGRIKDPTNINYHNGMFLAQKRI